MSSLALVEFLAARLDEDERAQRDPDDAWHPASCGAVPSRWRSEIGECDCGIPARVLREVEAKRAIVAAWLPPGESPHPGVPCTSDADGDPDGEDFNEPWNREPCVRHIATTKRRLLNDIALRLLAVPFADHPDYQESWKP